MMKNNLVLPLLLLLLFSLACSRFTGGDQVSNSAPAESMPSPTASITPASPDAGTGSQRKNLLALGSGAFVINKTSQYDRAWQAVNVLDESKKFGWSSDSGNPGAESITIELAAPTTLKSLSFDTASVDGADVAAKDITVEISNSSSTEGFREILSASLKNTQDDQEFPVKEAVSGQWLRVNFRSNHGSPKYNSVMEIRGYGDQDAPAPLENVSGTYDTPFGDFRIKQDGTSVSGCYEFDEGIFDGGIENRMMKLTWQEKGETKEKGPAMMFFSKDGKQFAGVWSTGSFENGLSGEWSGKKISDKVGNCAHRKDLDGGKPGEDTLAKSLTDDGRALVYGINFDFNSDKIKQESKAPLDQIVAVLKQNAGWKMLIEGHTDNIGGDAFNRDLSQKRAAAVKAFLVNAGIEEGRLSVAGLGMSKPIGSNETEHGRAQNRRVELVKQ